MKRLLANSLLVIGSICVTLAVAEWGLRYTPYANIPITGYFYPSGYFMEDAVDGYDIGPNITGKLHNLPDYQYPVFSNRFGCFDENRPVPDNYGIIVGDSFTWGYTPLEYKWTTKLEQLSGHFLLKCGVTGYGTKQELDKLKKVARAVGKPPKYIIVLYTGNDINDDFFFPQRTTVNNGIFAPAIKSLNMDTGEITRYTRAQLEKMCSNIYDNRHRWPLLNKLHAQFDQLVLYRVIHSALKALPSLVRPNIGPVFPAEKYDRLPSGISTEGVYYPTLILYSELYYKEWYNRAAAKHEAALIGMVDYAQAIGAKLLFVEVDDFLKRRRWQQFMSRFDNQRFFYYSLAPADQYHHWPNDRHWDIEGNQVVGTKIYEYADKVHFFQ